MDRQAILEKLTTVMAELFGLDRATLTPEVRFEDLELTSLDAIDLVIELQSFTGHKVEEARLREVRTIGEMVSVFESQRAPDDSA